MHNDCDFSDFSDISNIAITKPCWAELDYDPLYEGERGHILNYLQTSGAATFILLKATHISHHSYIQ